MILASWNLNSIKARKDRLLAWLELRKPDVLCLQELKVAQEDFPFAELSERGYHAAVYGQKTYNGVAILSRAPATDVQLGFQDGVDDGHSRFLAATVEGVRVLSAYFPNGGELGSDKTAYKLEWMRRLATYLGRHCDPQQPLALCGDFNVAPEARDVERPLVWERTVLFAPEMRAALEPIRAFGLADSFRLHHEAGGFYSWWDYRMLGFPKNDGLRIDHIWLTAPLASRCAGARIDREERKGKQPSDHAPVLAELR